MLIEWSWRPTEVILGFVVVTGLMTVLHIVNNDNKINNSTLDNIRKEINDVKKNYKEHLDEMNLIKIENIEYNKKIIIITQQLVDISRESKDALTTIRKSVDIIEKNGDKK